MWNNLSSLPLPINRTILGPLYMFPKPCPNPIVQVTECVPSSVSVLGLDKVGKGLGLLEFGAMVVVVVVIFRTNVVHLVDAAAFGASLDWALLGKLHAIESRQLKTMFPLYWLNGIPDEQMGTDTEPSDNVRVGRRAGATSKLLVTRRANEYGVLHRSLAAGIERPHVENINTLHLAEDFQTLQAGSLLEIGGNGSGLGSRAVQIVLGPDLWREEKDTRVSRFSNNLLQMTARTVSIAGWIPFP